ncbi:MAG: hypothetical protein ACR2PI_20375 [Hyphomicrobiaceae bacterium]
MFTLTASQDAGGCFRLAATKPLSVADFYVIAGKLQTPPVAARKTAEIAARMSDKEQQIETHWNGKETSNMARPGDWIVTSLANDRRPLRDEDGNLNTYVIRSERFPELYEATAGCNGYGKFYRSVSQVEAIYLPGGFEIMAPWQEIQRAVSGYLLCNGDEVYGNDVETFTATYEFNR